MSKPTKNHDKEMMELGHKLQNFYEMGYVSKKQAISFSFIKGLATGAGAFLGGTIVIALLIWLLGLFDTVPLVGHLVDVLRHSSAAK
jgi:hypothetical protein